MKMTLERAVSAAQIMTRLNGIRMKSSATARKIFTLTEELKPNFDFYANEEKKLIEELGGAISEDGTILFADQKEGIQKLKAGREELLKTYDGLEGEALKEAVKNSQWKQGSMTFTTSASGRVIVCLQNNRAYDAKNPQNSAFYLDDIEIFEQR